MSSPDTTMATTPRPARGSIAALLDVAFGYAVWAAHLLVVYVATAVACQVGLGRASEGTRTAFLLTLSLVTAAAVTVVVLHAIRRYRQLHIEPDRRFRMWVTIGGDAIGGLAIVWQLIPILLVPVCA